MAVTDKAKRSRVSNYWLNEYSCSRCGGDATIEGGHVRVNHHKRCSLRKRLYKQFPGFMQILEKEWLGNG